MKNENEIPKKKILKKVTIMKIKKIEPNNSVQRSVDTIKHNIFPKIRKKILKNKNYNRNVYNSQKQINKNIIPIINLNDKDQNLNSTINIIDNSRNNSQINNNNYVSLKKSFNKTIDYPLNNSINKSKNIIFNKTISKSFFDLKEINKEMINNHRKLFKSKTQSPIITNKNTLPNINNNMNNNAINNNSPIKSYLNKKSIPVKKIYDYYISQESKNIIKPITNFDKFFKKKYKDPKKRFNKIYCINQSYIRRTKEIKNNNKIAFKDDFDIDEYQNALLQFLQNRVDLANLLSLGQNYKEFNEKINQKFSFKGRYTDLANRIKNHAPTYLINKLRDLDKNKLIKRAKFLKSSIDIDKKKDNKKENYFEEFEIYLENKHMLNVYKK
jgi:hypothetical protein